MAEGRREGGPVLLHMVVMDELLAAHVHVHGHQGLGEDGGEGGSGLEGGEAWVAGLEQVHQQVVPTVRVQLQLTEK